ncbi:ATP synthase delta/epsilon chain alpha-helix domain-containing protein [Clostridium sp.]|uniref:ATP synthase delta/epsilon chain alpha-helix domain-containing protein n=1 Tax=Clostridium sp. TaxID=1506 RepID=UPI0025C62B46|nr:ATP synthase delta/epsilon chain alpha-helix domain-containing protein [Clostridium sp.]
MSKTFKISIIAPGKELLKLEAESLITLTKDGEIEFRANHTPIIISTIPTTTLIVNGNNKERIFTSSGIVYLKNNELKFCCDAVEKESDIDVDRAEKSKERAEKRLKEDKNIDIERAKRALARANARISTISINN